MAREKPKASEPVSAEDLTAAIQAITQAAQAQAASAAQIMQVMQQIAQLMQQQAALIAGAAPAAAPAPPPATISIWEDDPYSEETATPNPAAASTISVAVPVNNNPLLQTSIAGPTPAPGPYAPLTPNFRYWVAAEAIARGINFWAPLLPPQTRWTTTASPMRVTLVAGQALNANYSRMFGLRFYQQAVRNITVYSGESSDVVCHELGHAILDAVRPQLFDAASTEAAAFHESFGDMSAILCNLQLPSLRQKVLHETHGQLNVNSRLSRLAEQLGWAIRQLQPLAADQDCLRNAANRFFYRDPRRLPPQAPATQLSSDAHSFSRVFTGGFLDALAGMFLAAGAITDQGLQQVVRDMGQLLADAVRLAAITPAFYSQVAAALVQADRTRFQGRYGAALTTAFVQRGILAVGAVADLDQAPVPALAPPEPGVAGAAMLTLGEEDDGYRRTAADAPTLPTRSVPTSLGFSVEVQAPAQPERFDVAPAALEGEGDNRTADDAAAAFVEDLIQGGRLEGQAGPALAAVACAATEDETRKTHTLVPGPDGKVTLKRLHFDCGFPGCCGEP